MSLSSSGLCVTLPPIEQPVCSTCGCDRVGSTGNDQTTGERKLTQSMPGVGAAGGSAVVSLNNWGPLCGGPAGPGTVIDEWAYLTEENGGDKVSVVLGS